MTRKQSLIELRDKVKAGADIWPSDFPLGFKGTQWGIRAYEGSLDAAKSLHEAVLAEWTYVDLLQRGQRHSAHVAKGVLRETYTGISDNPARAWLLAILEALIAQEPDQ
jgi:hypothetical protein